MQSSDFHDLVRITKDAGAFYFGRDLTYRGNMLVNNSWHGSEATRPPESSVALKRDLLFPLLAYAQ